MQKFHGSYKSSDVTFLLDPIVVTEDGVPPGTPQAEGAAAYEVQIASEAPMSPLYLSYFYGALERNKTRIAYDVAQVARALAARPNEELVLASLVRAGTPIGVLLHRALVMLGRKSVHYSISATRKRGSDPCALDAIIRDHSPEDIVFVDGWTGKGYIATELREAMHGFNFSRHVNINPELVVLADLAGVAGLSASADDYLIPAAMLRSTVCGLISASMLNPRNVPGLPDACLFYEHLRSYDLSAFFVDAVSEEVAKVLPSLVGTPVIAWDEEAKQQARLVSDAFVDETMRMYGIVERNKVKPGICEANRALLTRANQMQLVVRDLQGDGEDLANLLALAEAKGVVVSENSALPYRAAVLLTA